MPIPQKLLLVCLLLIPMLSFSQYPTAVGTKWEYFQFREDFYVPQEMITAWQDEVVGDTVAVGNTYQIVRRTGTLYNRFGFPPSNNFDTLDGTFYTRVIGTQVWVLDSVVLGNAEESLLYEFGVPTGLPSEPLQNLVSLTPAGRVQGSHAERFNNEVLCQPMLCDSMVPVHQVPASLPRWPASSTWQSGYQNLFLPDIGTVYSLPYVIVLDQFGEDYYLRELTSNGQTLYRTPMLMSALDEKNVAFMMLSPNPASDQISVTAAEPLTEVALMDMTGKTVLAQTCDRVATQTMLNVRQLPRGLYWLVARGESQVATKAVLLR